MNHTKDEANELIETLYRRHYDNMLAMIRKDFACASVAEDIAQDVFKEAVRNGEKLLDHENPDGWIFETARNKMMSLKKKLYNRSMRELYEVEIEWIGMQADFGKVELSYLMDKTLNEHEIMLFYMYYFGGYSARELAKMEGITEGNFKVRMLRIRKKLKDALKGIRE